jgi:hypothetical protein
MEDTTDLLVLLDYAYSLTDSSKLLSVVEISQVSSDLFTGLRTTGYYPHIPRIIYVLHDPSIKDCRDTYLHRYRLFNGDVWPGSTIQESVQARHQGRRVLATISHSLWAP